MGFFKEKQKVKKLTQITISPTQLISIIEYANSNIDQFQIEYEVEFFHEGVMHVIGIDYDRNSAPKKGVDLNYISYYLDKQKFSTIMDLSQNALINGERFLDYGCVFVVDACYSNIC